MKKLRICSDLEDLVEEIGLHEMSEKMAKATGLTLQTIKEWVRRVQDPSSGSFIVLANEKLAAIGCELAIVRKATPYQKARSMELSRLRKFKIAIAKAVNNLEEKGENQ